MRLLLVSLCGFLISCTGRHEGTIIGRVREPIYGRPVRNVAVILDSTDRFSLTDSSGLFKFAGIAVGTYSMTCASDTSRALTEDCRCQTLENVMVEDGRTTNVELIRPTPQDEIHLHHEFPRRSFQKNGVTLYDGCWLYDPSFGAASPETWIRLVGVKDGVKRILSHPIDWQGYADIKDTAQALEFVRLFTSFWTPRGVDSNLCFEAVRAPPHNKIWMYMDAQAFDNLGLHIPTVQRLHKDFVVERYLYNRKRQIYRVKERVTIDGGYQLIEKTYVRTSDQCRVQSYL